MVEFLKKALPWIGAAATGNVPALVTMAAREISGVLGVDVQPKAEAIAEAVAGASPEQIAAMRAREMEFKERMQALGFKHEEELARIDVEASKAQTDRVAQLEGTASDLKSMPWLGPLMLFLRGCQRPAFGFGTLYADYMVFSAAWKLVPGPVENAFFLINVLVLAFLFGERAIQNIAPFVAEMLKARVGVKT